MKTDKRGVESVKKVIDKLTRFLSFGLVILLLFSLLGRISRMKEVSSKIEREKEKLDKLADENNKLQKNFEMAQSEEYVEKQLRDNLGLAKDGEIVVVLPDSETVKKFAPRLDDEEEIFPEPNWKKWIKLFL